MSAAASFTSQGGDLYGDSEDNRGTSIAIVPSAFHFVAPGLAIGGDLSFARQSQGDYSFTMWGVGPKVGYFFRTEGNAIPYLGAGVSYMSVGDEDDSDTGYGLKAGAGILITKGHLGVLIEAGYMHHSFKFDGADEATTGNMFVVGVGLAGLLY